MDAPKNPLTDASLYNAIFPWSHPVDPFCVCQRCHLVRARRILNQCEVIRRGIEMLTWDRPPVEMHHPLRRDADATRVAKVK